MKPDWCPDDIWEQTGMTFDQLYDAEPDLEGGCEQGVREYAARIALNARSKAFEEAADFLQKNHTIFHGEPADPVMSELVQAIRQHSQKGRDNE